MKIGVPVIVGNIVAAQVYRYIFSFLIGGVDDKRDVLDTTVFCKMPIILVLEKREGDSFFLIGREQRKMIRFGFLVHITTVAGNQLVTNTGIPPGADILYMPYVQQVFGFPFSSSRKIFQSGERGCRIEK